MNCACTPGQDPLKAPHLAQHSSDRSSQYYPKLFGPGFFERHSSHPVLHLCQSNIWLQLAGAVLRPGVVELTAESQRR